MGMRKLDRQLDALNSAMSAAMMNPTSELVGRANAEFKKLRFMLEGLSSFVEHRWEIKIVRKIGKASVTSWTVIRAENLEHARQQAINHFDELDDAVSYELYCDGILIPEQE